MTVPAGEPFSEAVGEAVQTSVMAWRLVMAVADAVRRQQQRTRGKEEELPPADQAVRETAAEVKNLVPLDISTALMDAADWPQMAQQLVALRSAGVDLGEFLPRVGDIAVTVRDAVAANSARVAFEGTEKWVRVLRETMPAGPVREAILSSPRWSEIAATMGRLDERGVDVRQLLAATHNEGVGVDQTVARGLATDSAPTTSRDALMSYGPLTTGLDIPKNLDLDDRARALHRQLAISPQENERYERWVMAAMPGREREARALVSARRWPLVAARMAQMESEGKPVREHLTRLLGDTSWEKGPDLGSQLVSATLEALRRPVGDGPAASRGKVDTTAARSQSVTLDPTKRQAAKGASPEEAGVAPHRQQSGPAPGRGKAR